MSADQSLYAVLGVSPDASSHEIERACLRLGDKYRPDKNPGDADAARMFAVFEQAFFTLADPAKRAAYDQSIGIKSSIKNNGLGKCRTCGEKVAVSAKACPHCGQEHP